MSPYPEELNNFCLVLFLQCAIVSVPPPSPPSPFVCCSSVWVCLCVCVYPFLWEGQSLVRSPRVFSHADQPHRPLHTGFHMDLLLVFSFVTKPTCPAWLADWPPAPFSGHKAHWLPLLLTRLRARGSCLFGSSQSCEQTNWSFFLFCFFFFVNQVFEFWHSVSLESCLPHRANHASPTWVQCGLQIRVPSGFFSWVPWWPHLCLPTYAERMIHK